MAEFEYVNLAIVRTSTAAGHSCGIEYSYHLHTDNREYEAGAVYQVGCVLYGDDILRHKTLGEPPYDIHVVNSHDPMPVTRHFMVPCDSLNEAWGRDDIFLRLIATSPSGDHITIDSATVSDWF